MVTIYFDEVRQSRGIATAKQASSHFSSVGTKPTVISAISSCRVEYIIEVNMSPLEDCLSCSAPSLRNSVGGKVVPSAVEHLRPHLRRLLDQGLDEVRGPYGQ
jgi:hypothetical protein